MSDEQHSDNPVLSGLVALLAVALAVGLILAGMAVLATRMIGLGGDGSAVAEGTGEESVYIPPFERTTSSGPAVTLATDDTSDDLTETREPRARESSTAPGDEATGRPITLQAGQTEVGNFERIDLSGIYPGGEGAILRVQRFENGQWVDFNAEVGVSGETFSTYIQSALAGVNRLRVVDTDNGKTSNEVRVTVAQ